MRAQFYKDCCRAALGPLTLVNHYFTRWLLQPSPEERVVLNLGSGTHPIRERGFVNVDVNPAHHPDLWLNVMHGLPFSAGTISAVVASHLLEHFYRRQVQHVLDEAWRVLRPDGVVRIVTPDLGKAVNAYRTGNRDFFLDWPDAYESLGGKLNNYLLCRDQHHLMFDFGLMQELLVTAGFCDCRQVLPDESRIFSSAELQSMHWETTRAHRSLFVEAAKPCQDQPGLAEKDGTADGNTARRMAASSRSRLPSGTSDSRRLRLPTGTPLA